MYVRKIYQSWHLIFTTYVYFATWADILYQLQVAICDSPGLHIFLLLVFNLLIGSCFLPSHVNLLPCYWDPTYRTHLTYIVQQVIVDRPDNGCIAETCSLVLLT
jgi:hypothetical protein